jgi:ATP-dependent Clp protease ATP-binding subunit ClpA
LRRSVYGVFERFTDRARKVVVLAQEEARLLNHNYIGTEHLLLGLIQEGEGIAAKVLERLGVSRSVVRARVEEIIGQGGSSPSGHIPFTPRAKKVLELSLREALQLGHNDIGTEHLLLGLIREGEGVAAQVLAQLGLDSSLVRQDVIQLLSGYPPLGAGPPRTAPPTDTPAGARAREEARRLAGDRPVGTHHVVSAILEDDQSLGAKALTALGVTAEALEGQLARLSPADTSDELPEEAGARHIRIEVLDNGVAVVLEDDALRNRLATALADDSKVLRVDHAGGASFPGLWQDVTRHLADVARLLEMQASQSWRPPEWDQEWDVAAYAVIQGAGGIRSLLEVAEGVERDQVRKALGRWLTDHQPTEEDAATYMVIRVRTSGGGKWTFELAFGDRPNWPRTQPQHLTAHAVLDLTAASRRPRRA